MAVNPYSTQAISGYNSSPPPDDGSQTDANKVAWTKHKTKLADPVKTLAEAVNSQALSAFNRLALETWTAVTTTATVAESDWHTGLLMLATGRVNFPDPGGLEDGWHTAVFNGSTGSIQLQATATTTFRSLTGSAASEVILPAGQGARVYNTATTYLAMGLSSTATAPAVTAVNDASIMIASQMFS